MDDFLRLITWLFPPKSAKLILLNIRLTNLSCLISEVYVFFLCMCLHKYAIILLEFNKSFFFFSCDELSVYGIFSQLISEVHFYFVLHITKPILLRKVHLSKMGNFFVVNFQSMWLISSFVPLFHQERYTSNISNLSGLWQPYCLFRRMREVDLQALAILLIVHAQIH